MNDQFDSRRQFLLRLGRAGAGAMVMASPLVTRAAQKLSEVQRVRIYNQPGRTRVVFDLSAPVGHSYFSLDNPDRVALDLRQVRFSTNVPKLHQIPKLNRMRVGIRNGYDLRVVFEMSERSEAKTAVLPPSGRWGHRLVVDLYDRGTGPAQTHAKKKASKPKRKLRNVVVAIDPGHGGKDPGAIGPSKVREKDVALAIGRQLHAMLKRRKGITPVMIRNKDEFVPLRDRMARARRKNADLLISIHADAFHDKQARGSSVYALSDKGATSEAAQWLADKENSADMVGGISIKHRNPMVARVLVDLFQANTMESSLHLGAEVLGQLKSVNKLHKRRVERAPFAVLKSPDIPSILIESAFISNPQEERRLRSKDYQIKLARAIQSGIVTYFKERPPQGTVFSA